MHAWKNLGYSPEAKSWLEREYPSCAYELAIALLYAVKRELRANADSWSGNPAADAQIVQLALEHEEGFDRILSAIQNSPKLRAALRRESPRLARGAASEPEATEAILISMVQQYPPEVPDEYRKLEPMLELEGGWKWVWVPENMKWAEGQEMQHCGQAHQSMVSLRDPAGKPHVTADFHPSGWVGQLRSKQNAPVHQKYWPAVEALFRKILESPTAQGKRWIEFDDPVYPDRGDGRRFIKRFLHLKLIDPSYYRVHSSNDGGGYGFEDVPEDE